MVHLLKMPRDCMKMIGLLALQTLLRTGRIKQSSSGQPYLESISGKRCNSDRSPRGRMHGGGAINARERRRRKAHQRRRISRSERLPPPRRRALARV